VVTHPPSGACYAGGAAGRARYSSVLLGLAVTPASTPLIISVMIPRCQPNHPSPGLLRAGHGRRSQPTTVAIAPVAAADQESPRRLGRARENAKAAKLRIVYRQPISALLLNRLSAIVLRSRRPILTFVLCLLLSPTRSASCGAVNEIVFKTEAYRLRHGRSAKCFDEGRAWPRC